MEVGSRQEVDRQVRRPLWGCKEAGPLPAREELADGLRPKERVGESRRLLDSKRRGELQCPSLFSKDPVGLSGLRLRCA